MTRKQQRRRGMTLIEIMVVITILGLIAAAVGVAVIPMLNESRRDRVGLDIKNIQNGMKIYYTRKGQYPDTGAGLRALVALGVFEAVPKDPWGNDYVYMNEGGQPVILSYGADGTSGGEGNDADISSKDAPQVATR
ncbi:type II secretion system protein GspG [Hyalangium gracile]|uniref:type II secretion system protein GspG n=1 Tax=Hyalangium gracile TaxID=394092 RepID=UPI001CCBCC6A|nr:type II secretion system protein GspG [Hyalangium gracile]